MYTERDEKGSTQEDEKQASYEKSWEQLSYKSLGGGHRITAEQRLTWVLKQQRTSTELRIETEDEDTPVK